MSMVKECELPQEREDAVQAVQGWEISVLVLDVGGLSGSGLEQLLFCVCVSWYVNARMIKVMNIVTLKSCWLVKIFVARMGHGLT